MLEQESAVRQPGGAPTSTPARLARCPVQQPFRFENLPTELRHEIYRLCLINETPIPIVVDEPCASDGVRSSEAQFFDNPEPEQLTPRIGRSPMERLTIDAGLLCVSRTIREEAAEFLYGHNTFRFLGEDCWIDLFRFHRRLTQVGRQHLRYVEIALPETKWSRSVKIVSQLSELSVSGTELSKVLPDLRVLTLRVSDDIMIANIELLRRIRHACKEECHIVMDIRTALLYNGLREPEDRPIRISSVAIKRMSEWQWNIKGEYELVGEGHHFKEKAVWLRWLRLNAQKGMPRLKFLRHRKAFINSIQNHRAYLRSQINHQAYFESQINI